MNFRVHSSDLTPEELSVIKALDPKATGDHQYLNILKLVDEDVEMELSDLGEVTEYQNGPARMLTAGRLHVSLYNGYCHIAHEDFDL